MRFDYLRDAPPEVVERLRVVSATPQVRALLAFVATATLAIGFAWGMELTGLHEARQGLVQARGRLDRSDAAAAAVRADIAFLRRQLVLDGRLRRIRLSGAVAAHKMTLLASRLPPRVWLTSIASTPDGYDVIGRALGLDEVGRALRAYPAIRLVAVRAPTEPHARILTFQLHVSTP